MADSERMMQKLFDAVEECKDSILAAERYIWNNAETGFREWKSHEYMKEQFLRLGYEITEAGDIPGFYADVDTGRPGPKIGIFAELDALLIPDHPQKNPETGAVHACGHNCQCAAMVGVAAALKAEGALDGLSGSVRLFVVPAEELIEIGYRKELIEKGILHYFGGKQEFLYRGYVDGVDIAMQVHTGGKRFGMECGGNGCVSKQYTFIGKASHGANPAAGLNALYAATNAMNMVNAIREQFGEDSRLRFHPIITKGGEAVNVIPAEVVVESYMRGGNVASIKKANDKANRAFASAAAGMGCRLYISDKIGYCPRIENAALQEPFFEMARRFFSPEQIRENRPWSTGCTDMGDLSVLMPTIIAYTPCSSKAGHTKDFVVEDPVSACVTNAKMQLGWLVRLMENDAEYSKKAIAEAELPYKTKEEFFAVMEELSFEGEAVSYNEDGRICIKYKN